MELFEELQRIILTQSIEEKCTGAQTLASRFLDPQSCDIEMTHDQKIHQFPSAGLPKKLELVAPRQLKKRGMQSQLGRNTLMHAVAHIEFNAINLALDAAYRFRHQPLAYYQDWISVAGDEARHFGLVRQYLIEHECDYGDLPVHNGLWDMAVRTADDVVARMALVPRVLEARGLDVTPGMIKKLQSVGDSSAVAILETIYQDEIGHVKIGSDWFKTVCKKRDLEPRGTFKKMVERHLHGELKGPFNIAARLQAGFDEIELDDLAGKSSI